MKFIKANTRSNILQCPFCGEKEEIYLEEYEIKCGSRWRILCTNCMCAIDRGYDQHPNILIELWNKRTNTAKQ